MLIRKTVKHYYKDEVSTSEAKFQRIKSNKVPNFYSCSWSTKEILLSDKKVEINYRQGNYTSSCYFLYEDAWYYSSNNYDFFFSNGRDVSFEIISNDFREIKNPRKRLTRNDIPHVYAGTRDLLKTDEDRARYKLLNEGNDCTVIATAIAANVSYFEAHRWMKSRGRTNGKGYNYSLDNGEKIVGKSTIKLDFRVYNGPKRSKGITLARFCREYTTGRFVVLTSNHALAVINGVIYDGFFEPNRIINFAYKIEEC